MSTFEQVISGLGNVRRIPGTHMTIKTLADRVKCVDGTELSVQASSTHYCCPRSDRGPYSHVEVGYPTATPPDTWAYYADGEYPNVNVYGYVPVELVRAFIQEHGGEVS